MFSSRLKEREGKLKHGGYNHEGFGSVVDINITSIQTPENLEKELYRRFRSIASGLAFI